VEHLELSYTTDKMRIPLVADKDQAILSAHDEKAPTPIRKHKFPEPKLRVHLNDLSHPGSGTILNRLRPAEDFSEQVQNVLNLLYNPEDPRPATRSITLVLRDCGGGVAYTTGIELDDDHKEIHFDLNYIWNNSDHNASADKATPQTREELLGVICHELVHCFQWNAENTAPGGLIEGIADWVRLRAGLAAKHWRREAGGDWDAGYQHTGYFLEYLEQRFGEGTVKGINARLREDQYDEEEFWKDCCDGKTVEKLWEDYRKSLKELDEGVSTLG
jgi:hypothetical protein